MAIHTGHALWFAFLNPEITPWTNFDVLCVERRLPYHDLISENSYTGALGPPSTGQSLRHSASCILQVKRRYALAMLTFPP